MRVQLFRRRMFGVLFGRGALTGGTVAGFVCGAGVLAWRFAGQAPGWMWMAGGAALGIAVCATLTGLVSAMRHVPAAKKCAAALDAAEGAGGLVMCAGLEGSGAWRVRAAELPEVRARCGRMTAGLVLGAVFCGGAVALPGSLFTKRTTGRLALESVVEEVMKQVTMLEEETLLPAPLAEAISNELARVTESGEASDPGRMLEALDHLQEEVRRAGEEGAAALAQAVEEAQAVAALAALLADAMENGRIADDGLEGAKEGMEGMLSEMAAQGSSLFSAEELKEWAEGLAGAMSPEEAAQMLEKLSEGMCKGGGEGCERLAKLCEAGLARPGQCAGMSKEEGEAALAALLAQDGEAGEAARALAAMCASPGSGGISKGRGDAMMTWTDPSTTESVAFKEERLSPGWRPDLEDSELKGVSATAPKVEAGAEAVTGGVLGSGSAARGSTPGGVVLPRHRDAVRSYFGNQGTSNTGMQEKK